MEFIFIILISYLLGSIPNAYIIAKLSKGIDIRNYGSGSVGATNVFRVIGKFWGIITFFLDFLKGLLVVYLIDLLVSVEIYELLFCAFFGIIGHLFPLWLKFKGGKGVSIIAGIITYLSPLEFLIGLTVFIFLVSLTNYVSIGSIFGSITLPIAIYLNQYTKNLSKMYWLLSFTIILSIIIILMHRKNIKRLIQGKENKLLKKN